MATSGRQVYINEDYLFKDGIHAHEMGHQLGLEDKTKAEDKDKTLMYNGGDSMQPRPFPTAEEYTFAGRRKHSAHSSLQEKEK